MLLHQAFGHPEAEAGSEMLFGREKRFEQPGADMGRDSTSVIGDGNANSGSLRMFPIAPRCDVHAQLAFLRGSINGIGNEVGKDLPDFSDTRREFRSFV